MTTTGTNARSYVFDNHGPRTDEQLRCLAAAYDAITTERLAGLGVADGWHCWEVGYGGGSIARWLAERVAPGGHVLATDIVARPIERHPALTVAEHDIRTGPFAHQRYDLVVARLVLQHLPERDAVLTALVQALKPGGWIQIDEFGTSYEPVLLAPDDEAARLFAKFHTAKRELMRSAGGDPEWGRRAARAMRAAGLVDVDARPYLQPRVPGSAELDLQLHHTYHLRDGLLAVGMTQRELEALREVMRDPAFRASSSVIYSVQGRKECVR